MSRKTFLCLGRRAYASKGYVPRKAILYPEGCVGILRYISLLSFNFDGPTSMDRRDMILQYLAIVIAVKMLLLNNSMH